MVLNKELFERIAKEAEKSTKLRMAYDLRDSEDENTQRMLNVLLPGTKTSIHCHYESSEVVLCIYGSAIERFYDRDGNEKEMVIIAVGSDIPGVIIEKERFHSLEATEEIGVVVGVKSGCYRKSQDGIIDDK